MTCSKCGSSGISKRYCNGGWTCAARRFGTPAFLGDEHLDRVCGGCGYAFTEPCKGASTPPKETS